MKKSILLSAAILGVVAFNYQFSQIDTVKINEIEVERVDQLTVSSDLSMIYPMPIVIHYPLVVPYPILMEESE